MGWTGQDPNPVKADLDRMFGPMEKPFDELRNKHTGDHALIIGNSPDRAGFPLDAWKGVTIGCNAIYTEFWPDYVCIMDSNMIARATIDGVGARTNLVLRAGEMRAHVLNATKPENRGNWYVASKIGYMGLTGHMAIGLSGWMGCPSITLIGFTCDTRSMYAGQECYKKPPWSKANNYKMPPAAAPGGRPHELNRMRQAIANYKAAVPNGAVHWILDSGLVLEALSIYAQARKDNDVALIA